MTDSHPAPESLARIRLAVASVEWWIAIRDQTRQEAREAGIRATDLRNAGEPDRALKVHHQAHRLRERHFDLTQCSQFAFGALYRAAGSSGRTISQTAEFFEYGRIPEL